MKEKIAKEKIVSALYLSYGLIDISISAMSGLIPVHMIIVGLVCFAAGVGLWLKKFWSIYPVVFFGPLTLTVGASTLQSSIGLLGFGPSTQVLLFNLSLIGYSVAALVLSAYTIANRSKMMDHK